MQIFNHCDHPERNLLWQTRHTTSRLPPDGVVGAFIDAAGRRNERALFISFDENPGDITRVLATLNPDMEISADGPGLEGCSLGKPSRILHSINRCLLAWIVVGFTWLSLGATSASAAPTTMVDLGAASPYAVLSGASVANTVSAPGAPHTTIRGDLGIKADTAPTGFPPGVVTGTIRKGSSVDQAHGNAVSAYNAIANRQGGVVIPGALVGAVVLPGLYTIAGAASNTGTLTLNGGGDPNAVFVFQVDGALSFAAASHVVLTNGARASRVFWQVNGAGAIGALADFVGTMIAKDAVAMGNGTFVNGRAIALNGALTLDNNQFYSAPPVITIDGGETAYTTDTTPTIFGTTDLDAPGQVTVTIAGQTLTATPINGNWSVTSGILANAVYPVEASGTDAAGNPSSATQQLTVDTLPPEITLDGGAAVATKNSAPTISGTSDVSADTVVRVTIASQNLNALVQGNGNDSWNIRAANLADGIYQVTASVSDPAGNESIATQAITIDTTPPAVTISGGSDPQTNDATPTLSGTANVASGTTVRIIVGNQALTGLVDGNQRWSVTADALPDGVYSYLVIVSDAAGNEVRVERMLTINTVVLPVIIDGPSITRLAIVPNKVRLSGGNESSLSKLGPKIRLSLTETATVRFRITRTSFKAQTFRIQREDGASFVRIPMQIRKSLTFGSYRITAVATDSIGQVSTLMRTSFKVIP